jgi:predicted acetyltransferase
VILESDSISRRLSLKIEEIKSYHSMMIYHNLSQHYEAEFSQLTGKTPDAYGLYKITELDSSYIGFIAKVGSSPVGFMVIHQIEGIWDVAEFYVAPTHRRSRLGMALAFHIFNMFPGHWQVRQINGADRAKAFWVRTIDQFTQGNFSSETVNDGEWGEVLRQRFYVKAPALLNDKLMAIP